MKKKYLFLAGFWLGAALVVACGSSEPAPKKAAVIPVPNLGLVPMPRDISGATVPSGSQPIPTWCIRVAKGADGRDVFRRAGEPSRSWSRFQRPRRARLDPVTSPSCWPARGMRRRRILAPEGYSLDIGTDRITITAHAPSGLFYGAVTLWQIITAKPLQGVSISVPAVKIVDAPRFAWRGLMLDSARHYQSPSSSSSSSTGWRCTSSTSCTGT